MNLNAGAVLLIFHHQDEQLMAIMKRCLIFSIFRRITLVIRDKNTTFANKKSVLLISAEHCRIEKPAGFYIVTC